MGSMSSSEKVELPDKIVLVIKPFKGAPYLDRFDADGKFNEQQGLLPAEMYAKNDEEVGAVVRIDCTEKGSKDCALHIFDIKKNQWIAGREYFGMWPGRREKVFDKQVDPDQDEEENIKYL